MGLLPVSVRSAPVMVKPIRFLFLLMILGLLLLLFNQSLTTTTHQLLPPTVPVPTTTKARPYYMKEGQLRPERTVINPTTGKRNATVFPEERPGQDRIIDQLMFVPEEVPGVLLCHL